MSEHSGRMKGGESRTRAQKKRDGWWEGARSAKVQGCVAEGGRGGGGLSGRKSIPVYSHLAAA